MERSISFSRPTISPQQDAWMVEHVAGELDSDDPWRWVAALGTWGRLRRKTADQRTEAFEALMAGEPEPGAQRADVWAESLTDQQRQRLHEMFVSRLDMLGATFERLERDLAPGISGWVARYRRMLHGRDDVDSVLWALAETGALEGTGATLEGLDERGRRLVASLPSIDDLQGDERLVRAGCVHPEAWWVYPAIDQR